MATPKPKYSNEELKDKIEDYFASNPDKPTVTGLAYFLGFESRQSLYDYKERPESSYTIKKAVLRIESKHEEKLYEPSASGSIFWLKNRDWKDKQEREYSGELKLPSLQVEIVKPNESK
jgi:hypothetical protein